MVRGQEDAAHEARYAQLFDNFEQVDLQVELAESFGKQPVFLCTCSNFSFPLATAAAFGSDKPATKDALDSLLEVCPEALCPVISENVPRHDCLFKLALLFVVVVAKTVLAVALVVEGMVLGPLRLLPRKDLLDQRFVNRERLVASQREISHSSY